MGEYGMKQILARPIQLADQVSKWADETHTCHAECMDLKARTIKLADLLRQAARADLYERAARRIVDDTDHVLDKALALVERCRSHGLVRRLFTIIPTAAFAKMATLLDNSVADVSWLLRVSSTSVGGGSAAADDDDDDDMLHGLPPIAQNEPILFLIWDHIARLHTGSPDARSDSAGALASLARDNDHFAKLIIEEDGVGPLLRLLKEGRVEGQENAARALGLLGRDPESVDRLVAAGVCTTFAKVLKEGSMKVQVVVAWAIAELAANHPTCREVFAQNNAVRLLVVHLAYETIQDHSKYTIPSKAMTIHSVVLANKPNTDNGNGNGNAASVDDGGQDQNVVPRPGGSDGAQFHSVVKSTMPSGKFTKPQNQQSTNGSIGTMWKSPQPPIPTSNHKAREMEDPNTKANMKAMAAKALWRLAENNVGVCKSITESRALLCFAVLLEKGVGEVQYYSAMALMEIARVAENNTDLRRSAFKPSPAAKAVIDNFLQIVQKGENEDLLIPSITALGCLARTFRATETRIIGPLVQHLDEQKEAAVSRAAVSALTKFACTENYLHVSHSKEIIEAGGARHLVSLVYFGEQVQVEALVLLCYIAKHVPESQELAPAGVFAVLLWASKQAHMVQDHRVDELLPEAKTRMELYQSRSTR